MKVIVKASEFALPASEILSYVEPTILSYIKGFNEKPLLKAYVVASNEELVTPGFEAGYDGPTELSFSKEAVADVYEKIKPGNPIYYDHWEDSPKEKERETVGSVVGKALKKIGNKIYAIVVGFFNEDNEELALEHDSVSMEANWVIEPDGSVKSISEFDAVAIVPNQDKPAFKTAKSIGVVKAKDMTTPTSLDWHTLEAEFRKMKGLASQVSDPNEMIGDLQWSETGEPILTGVDKKYVAKAVELIKKAVEKAKSQKDPGITEKLAEYESLKKEIGMLKAKPMLLEKAKERKLGDEFVSFIEKRIERFKPSENIEESIKDFLDDKALDFADIYKQSTKEITKPDRQETKPTLDGEITDYNDPKQNPFLED
jgi:hypothetical protein